MSFRWAIWIDLITLVVNNIFRINKVINQICAVSIVDNKMLMKSLLPFNMMTLYKSKYKTRRLIIVVVVPISNT